ncbi:hypothetical protein [Cloacibacillus sp. An23]|uniref:hypothetical protein n=1 Tax=Cloacibacillus sp. An23 TaxID=1965591 RepID=UPI0013025D84|nr:hypothetical protein [Cloacibacillus sp. An23]
MIDITDFSPETVRGGSALMLGGNDRKAASFRALVEAWPRAFPEDALIVLDHSGRLYESFEGDAALADLSSAGSVVPDLIEPFALNETAGESSANIANAVRQAAYQEIRSRDANDKFFDDLGKLVTDRMIVYMLETERNVLLNIAGGEVEGVLPRLNLFTIFCRQHRYVESLMTKAVSGEKDALPDKRAIMGAEFRRGARTREYALAEYILDKELRFQKNGGREAPVPFADLLFTTSETSNTQRCIKMQADASTADFRALLSLVTEKAALLNGLPTLKLGKFFDSPDGVPLFVCSCGNAAADRGFAALLTAAAGAAAQNAGKRAVVFVPELDRWGLVNLLDKLRQNWDGLNFVFGYENFSRLSLESRSEEAQLIETLYSLSDRRVWHATKEERLNKAFASYVSDADVIYRPDDLDEELRAVEEDGRVRYTALEERPAERVRERIKLRARRGAEAKLWITGGAAKREPLTLESLLEEGESL